MENRLVNVRLFSWHFSIDERWRPSLSRNRWHKEHGWADGYFKVYLFFGWEKKT